MARGGARQLRLQEGTHRDALLVERLRERSGEAAAQSRRRERLCERDVLCTTPLAAHFGNADACDDGEWSAVGERLRREKVSSNVCGTHYKTVIIPLQARARSELLPTARLKEEVSARLHGSGQVVVGRVLQLRRLRFFVRRDVEARVLTDAQRLHREGVSARLRSNEAGVVYEYVALLAACVLARVWSVWSANAEVGSMTY